MSGYRPREEILQEFAQSYVYEAFREHIGIRANGHLSRLLDTSSTDEQRREAIYRLDELEKVLLDLESHDAERPAHRKLNRLVRVGQPG